MRRIFGSLAGRVIARDHTMAMRKLSAAAAPPAALHDASDVQAAIKLLDEGQLAAAVDKFANAASRGSANGNFYLGLAYDGLLGRDAREELPVEKDAAAAARCYERAASSGHALAMLNLSFCYRNGEGVVADVPTSFEWLSKSAAAGSERAQFNAAIALDPLHPPYGKPGQDMIAKDPVRAVALYREAVSNGHDKAKVNLGVSLYTGTGVDKNTAAARALWLEAHEAGVAQAAFCLSNMEEEPGRLENYFPGDEREATTRRSSRGA